MSQACQDTGQQGFELDQQGAWAHINVSALQHNFTQVQARLSQQGSQARILAVIKANAYGHGLLEVAHALPQAQGFAVARLSEGLQLRAAGIQQTILLLEGVDTVSQLQQAVAAGLQLVVHRPEHLEVLTTWATQHPRAKAVIWPKLETGMHRLGLTESELQYLLQHLPANITVASLVTHFACADELTNAATVSQLAQAQAIAQKQQLPLSCANSAAICGWPDSYADAVRPGIMLYGSSPVLGTSAEELGLRPVMRLCSHVIACKTVSTGAAVGYGATWVAQASSRIGIVSAGYADGYPRHAPNGTPVWVKGHEVPLLGRVSMDKIAVDLSEADAVCTGDVVELWGEHISVDRLAQHANTISYQLLCNVGPRVPRIYEA